MFCLWLGQVNFIECLLCANDCVEHLALITSHISVLQMRKSRLREFKELSPGLKQG